MKTILLLSLVSLLNISCDTYLGKSHPYDPPVYSNDGLDVGTLEEIGIDSQLILQANGRIHANKHNEVYSMLIYKDNLLVFEGYYDGHIYQWDAKNYHGGHVLWNKDMPHHVMSVSKSFTSACIGIAIDLGYIESVDQSIFDYLPHHQDMNTDNREYITIEHLVTMTCGLAWNEWAVPGDFFTYNGGGTVILGEIIRNASGMNLDAFSMKYLFEPLGIESTECTQYPNGMIDAAGSLKFTSRDMMKLDITYLNKGLWNGEEILSSHWVEMSSKVYRNNRGINIPGEDSGENGYGYTWWTSEFEESGVSIPIYRR